MKKIILILTYIYLMLHSPAQTNGIDSLRQLIAAAKDDSTKVNLLNDLSGAYEGTRPDSDLIVARQALELAQKIGFTKGEIRAMANVSAGFLWAGNYPQALDLALQALKKSEEIDDPKSIARSYSIIGGVYSFQGDYETGKQYEQMALHICEQLKDERSASYRLLNIGYNCQQLNQLDSARIYINKSNEIGLQQKNVEIIGSTYLNLGIIYTKMKLYDLSISYYRLSLPYFDTANHLFLGSIYQGLADVFDSTGKRDSAFYYARLAFNRAKILATPIMLQGISELLARLFKKENQVDSAFFYQQISMAAKDSLTSQEKQKRIQTMTFTEQLRQMDLAKEKEKAKDARKKNLQYAAISIGLIIFIIVFLVLSRSIIVKTKFIEFFSVLGLLAVFEFINLFIHPYLAHATNESPLLMLAVLIAIGALLIPLHHKIEKWITEKMVEKNKKLRLAAAKKTIAKLEGEQKE